MDGTNSPEQKTPPAGQDVSPKDIEEYFRNVAEIKRLVGKYKKGEYYDFKREGVTLGAEAEPLGLSASRARVSAASESEYSVVSYRSDPNDPKKFERVIIPHKDVLLNFYIKEDSEPNQQTPPMPSIRFSLILKDSILRLVYTGAGAADIEGWNANQGKILGGFTGEELDKISSAPSKRFYKDYHNIDRAIFSRTGVDPDKRRNIAEREMVAAAKVIRRALSTEPIAETEAPQVEAAGIALKTSGGSQEVHEVYNPEPQRKLVR